jgi:hypothetical protein
VNLTNELCLPEAIVAAVRNDPYSRGECDISVTQLIAPPRKVELERRHADELTEDASGRIWSLLGQAVHTVLERAGQNAFTEERLKMTVAGWVLSGAFDTLTLTENGGKWRLTDYKVTSSYAVKDGGKQEWVQQLNVLALLLREHGFEVADLQIVAILRDWSKLEALRDAEYPQKQVVVFVLPSWSHDERRAFVEHRIEMHKRARAGTLPDCTAEERWEKPAVYAVMKEGRKSALRLLKSEGEALDWCLQNGHATLGHGDDDPIFPTLKRGVSIVTRPAKQTRCEAYCAAAAYCDQWKRLQEEANGFQPATD